MVHELKNYIILATFLACFLPSIKREKWLPLVGLFLLLSLSSELIATWFLRSYEGNVVVYNVFILIDFILTSLILYQVSPLKKESKQIFVYSGVVLLVPVALFLMNKSPLQEFAAPVLLLAGLLITIHSTVVILRLGQYSDELVVKIPGFWIALSPFFYFACFVPSFGLMMYFATSNKELSENLYSITDYLFLLRYLLIFIGLTLPFIRRLNAK